jgi:hypothetical protein
VGCLGAERPEGKTKLRKCSAPSVADLPRSATANERASSGGHVTSDRHVLKATGAPWASVLRFGYWPQVKPALWALALLRWDINVRESSVLGLVAAGGIGVALNTAMNLFQWDRVAIVLIAIFAVVIAAEIVVTQIRKQLI